MSVSLAYDLAYTIAYLTLSMIFPDQFLNFLFFLTFPNFVTFLTSGATEN